MALTQMQQIQSLGEALAWLERELNWGVKPANLSHLGDLVTGASQRRSERMLLKHLRAFLQLLPFYVAEAQFRYNNRMNPEIFQAAIEGC